MKIEIRKSAIKDLKNISEPIKSNIHKKIRKLEIFPMFRKLKD